ncbi:MAG: DUF1553 domain-containing protein, partial [Phycisphaerae bacterium]|nr:DUF1553 domain-containing protein [Phycisphaerae bacterium]
KNYRYRTDYVRASEQVQQPARPGHFLREFGESERELIQGSNGDAAVTQALTLLNGFIQKNLLANSRAELIRSVAEVDSAEQKIDRIYLATLGRHPSESEMSAVRHDLKDDEKAAYQDLIWTLLNTHEFMFIQ